MHMDVVLLNPILIDIKYNYVLTQGTIKQQQHKTATMDVSTIIPELKNLVLALEKLATVKGDTAAKPESDYELLNGFLNNAESEVVIPGRRYIVSEPLVLDKFNYGKEIKFLDGAIVFFYFETSKENPAFVVNGSQCTIEGGTFVSNNHLFEVNGDGNVLKSMNGFGSYTLNGSCNDLTACAMINVDKKCGVCFGEKDGDEQQPALLLNGDETKVQHCLIVSTDTDLYKGIDREKWTFTHALVLERLTSLSSEHPEDWLCYDALYKLSREQLQMLSQFLDVEKQATNKHAKKVLEMVQCVLSGDNDYADKFFAMLKRPWNANHELLVLELYVLWETRTDTIRILTSFEKHAKLYAIDTLSRKTDGMSMSELIRVCLTKKLFGWVDFEDWKKLDAAAGDLWTNVRDQMLQDTCGLNGIPWV